METESQKQANPIKTGWITLLIGLFFCAVWGMTGGFLIIGMPSFLTMASIALALPLLLSSLILSIIGMCKNQPGRGVVLLTATLILPSVVVVVSGVVSSLFPLSDA